MSVAHGEQVGTLEEHGEAPGRSINWWGMIFFIASEALIFANIIAGFLYLEIRNGSWHLPTDLKSPLINTFILLGSSIPIRFAGRAIGQVAHRIFMIFLFFSILLAADFLGDKLSDSSGLLY